MLPALCKSWLRGLLCTPVLCLPAALAVADSCSDSDLEALQWLDRMTRSVDEISYHGVVTLQRRGEDMQVMQISSRVNDESSSERLTQLTGQGVEVRRLEHPLHCVHPGHRLLLRETRGQDECGLAGQYRFRMSEGTRVAGRSSMRLEVMPRDMYRFGYILELDHHTGLLLRSETIGLDHSILEKFQFADLAYDEGRTSSADISLVHRASHPGPGETGAPHSLSGGWLVRWLPRGFVPTDDVPADAARKTYTDGLAVFSVFIEELDRAIRPGEGLERAGSTTVYTRGIDLANTPLLVTVVGEIPVNTARMIADSVQWTH